MAGSIGNAVEWVDWALYTTFASIFAGQFFPSHDPAVNLLSTLVVFAVGFVMRPDRRSPARRLRGSSRPQEGHDPDHLADGRRRIGHRV